MKLYWPKKNRKTRFPAADTAARALRAKAQTSTDSDRSQNFFRLLEKVFERHEAMLANVSQIDVDDMLRISVQRLHEQPVQGRLKAILIDKFRRPLALLRAA